MFFPPFLLVRIPNPRGKMLSKFFVDRPKFALVIALVTALLGGIAVVFIPIAQYPDVVPPQVVVSATYPGANAALVESSVAIPIEEKVNGVSRMLYMTSTSSDNGQYQLTITFELGTDPDIAVVEVQNRVSLAQPLLPDSVTQQGISIDKHSSSMVLVINLVSPDSSRDALFLSNYAKINLQNPLARIPGVGSVSQFGPLDYSMRIWMRPDAMTALNLTAPDLVSAVQAQNSEPTAGQIGAPPFPETGLTDQQITLQAKGLLDRVEEFEGIVLKSSPSGQLVRVKDVARVELGAQSYSALSQLNNRPSAAIAVYQAPDANALEVADQVYVQMEEIAKAFPEGVTYELLYDVTKSVRASLEEIIKTIAITAGLVITVVFLFLRSWRAVLIPALAIPVSLLGTMAILFFVGFTANLITLFALILAITLVVDDSIVIIENTQRLMEEEELGIKEATLKAMGQVTRPIIATTFVLLAVFVPVCFFPGITGRIYLQFALTITVAFSLSAVNALTLGPALCVLLLRPGKEEPPRFLAWIPPLIEAVRKAYVWTVTFFLRRFFLSSGICIAVLAASIFMLRATPTGFLPIEDKGALFVNVMLPPGASLQRTQKTLEEFSEIVRATEGVSDVISVAGFSLLSNNGANFGTLIAILKPWSERTARETQWYAILAALDTQLSQRPEATSFVFPLPPIDGLGLSGGVEAQLSDTENRSVEQVIEGTDSFLSKAMETGLFRQIFTALAPVAPQYDLTLDRDKIQALGIQVNAIFTALQANLGALPVNNFLYKGQIYWVMLGAEAKSRSSLEDLSRIHLRTSTGEMVPLSTLLSVKPVLGSGMVTRFNALRAAPIQGMTQTGVSTGQAIAALEHLARQELPQGMALNWTGMTQQEVEAGALMIYVFLLAFIFAYLFLVAQYESWMLPVSVMVSTIFAVCGALLPLFLIPVMNNNLYAQIGIVLLIGLAAKKAIMLVEFSRVQHEEKGLSIDDAALKAAHTRFRPVTMTGLCFILGVIPLVLATGAGSASRISMGLPVFTGMLLDSTLGLIFIPVLYAFFERLRSWTFGKEEVSSKC